MDRLKRIAPFLKPLLILALFAIALRVLHDTLAHYRYHDVIGSWLIVLPPSTIENPSSVLALRGADQHGAPNLACKGLFLIRIRNLTLIPF